MAKGIGGLGETPDAQRENCNRLDERTALLKEQGETLADILGRLEKMHGILHGGEIEYGEEKEKEKETDTKEKCNASSYGRLLSQIDFLGAVLRRVDTAVTSLEEKL